jgi:hypothetical protein
MVAVIVERTLKAMNISNLRELKVKIIVLSVDELWVYFTRLVVEAAAHQAEVKRHEIDQ